MFILEELSQNIEEATREKYIIGDLKARVGKIHAVLKSYLYIRGKIRSNNGLTTFPLPNQRFLQECNRKLPDCQ